MFDETSNIQFPWKLHMLLEEAERKGYGHIISWLPTGNAFKVHDKTEFAELIMPKYFHSNKYKSFQRNLNLWCFQTLTKEPNKGAIFHPYFLRCNPDRCHLMKRIKVKKNSRRTSLAELRASAPPVSTKPLPSTLFRDTKAVPSTLPQTSALNAAQLMFLTQQHNERSQQRQLQLQCQNLVQSLTGPVPCHLSSLLSIAAHARAPTKQAAATSPSGLDSLLLNHLAQKQVFANSRLAVPPASARTSSPLDLNRLKMQIGLALATTNTPSASTTMMGPNGLLRNEATSSK